MEDNKIEETVNAALLVETFSEKKCLTSQFSFFLQISQDSRGQRICLTMNKNIQKLQLEILKMSRQVRSVNLVKVVDSNDITTSPVEVPCSAKQSGFKKQSRKFGWVKGILYKDSLYACRCSKVAHDLP